MSFLFVHDNWKIIWKLSYTEKFFDAKRNLGALEIDYPEPDFISFQIIMIWVRFSLPFAWNFPFGTWILYCTRIYPSPLPCNSDSRRYEQYSNAAQVSGSIYRILLNYAKPSSSVFGLVFHRMQWVPHRNTLTKFIYTKFMKNLRKIVEFSGLIWISADFSTEYARKQHSF